LITDLDTSLPLVYVVPQDIGRVLLAKEEFLSSAKATEDKSDLSTGNAMKEEASAKEVGERTNLAGLEPIIPGVNLPGFTFSPTFTLSTKNLGDKIEIQIRDNGPGISPNIFDKIFQPLPDRISGAGSRDLSLPSASL